MIGVIIGSRKVGINPDNVATPIAASLGDLITLSLLAGVSSTLYEHIGEETVRVKVESWRKSVTPGRFKHLLSMTAAHMWIYTFYPNQRKLWMSLFCIQENLSDDKEHFDHYIKSFFSSSWTQDGSRSHVYFPMARAGTDVQHCNVLVCMLFYYISVYISQAI